MDHDWVLDELAHAGPEHLDAGYVAGYDAKSGFDPAEDLALLQAHGLDAQATLVDLGAGTGRLSRTAARACAGAWLPWTSRRRCWPRSAREAERSGLANVELVHAGFLSYEHSGPPADFVFTRNALHQIPDFWKVIALDRIGRVLRPGGILLLRDLVYDFRPAEAESVFEEWFDHAATDPRAVTRAPTSSNTSARSTAPSAGCSNRC